MPVNIKFDGKKENYMRWASKVKAYAGYKGFLSAYTEDVKDEKVVNDGYVYDEKDADDIIKKKYYTNNAAAYTLLACNINNPVAELAVSGSTTQSRPHGCARSAWKALEKLYKPVNDAT